MKDIKKLIFILACILAIICVIIIARTYSKYRTSADGSAEVSIARWNIKINNETIRNNSNISAIITPIFEGTDDISANIIAPTAQGYFDINMDYTDTDVSFDYEITVNPSASSPVQDLIPTGYALNNNYSTVYPMTDLYTISGTAENNDASKTKNIRVYIEWDDETGSMDNASDTNTTIPDNAKTQLNVSFHFIQNPDTSTP